MKYCIKNMIYRITSKKIVETDLECKTLQVRKNNLRYFSLSSNVIVSFEAEGKNYYFRECSERLSKKSFFLKAMDSFFWNINLFGIHEEHFKQEIPIQTEFSDQIVASFKAYIETKKGDRLFWKCVFDADRISYKEGFSIWQPRTYNQEFFLKFGMGDLPEELIQIAVYFLWNMRSAAGNYRMMNIAVGEHHSFFSAVRAKASKIIAEELKLDHMITSAEWCNLQIENEESVFGLLSEAAPGSRMIDSNCTCDGSLQKELLNLNLLDLICYQADHGPNNYNVIKDEPAGYCVCAFDNDNPSTFFPMTVMTKSLSGCSSFLKKDGTVNRPYFSKAVVEHLEKLNDKHLTRRLKPYLNVFQRYAVIYRIKKIRRAFDQTTKTMPGFLLNDEEWNEKTAMKELSGDYGVTYLGKAIRDRNGEKNESGIYK